MSELKITSVKFDNFVNKRGVSIKANGSVQINNSLVLKFAIMDGKNGLFVSYKGRETYVDKKTQETKSSNAIYFTDKEVGQQFQEHILNEYDKSLASRED